MKFQATEPFWKAYAKLPKQVKESARRAFLLFQEGAKSPPFHPSLRIRKMQGHPDIWEGHVTRDYVFTFHDGALVPEPGISPPMQPHA
jgi:mRNA interferase RelE/StbE